MIAASCFAYPPFVVELSSSGAGEIPHELRQQVRICGQRELPQARQPLDGVLYPQRMRDMSKLIFESEIRHWVRPPEE